MPPTLRPKERVIADERHTLAQRWWGPEGRLLPVDRLLLGTIAVLAVLAVFHPSPGGYLGLLALNAGVIVGAAGWSERSRSARFIHAFTALPVVITIFDAIGPLIAAMNPRRWDDRWSALDRGIFGDLAWHWHHFLGRPTWLTDASYLLYVSYYVLPVALAVGLYTRNRRVQFEQLVFTTVTIFLCSYVGYFAFPTSGPRVPDLIANEVLGGGVLSRAIRSFLLFSERNTLDAFPSAHTAVSLVLLGLGWHFFPRWRVVLVLHVGAIIFTTVYLSFHYVVDLVAGGVLALMMFVLVPLLRRLVGSPPDSWSLEHHQGP